MLPIPRRKKEDLTLGGRIAAARRKLNLSRAEFARLIGKTRSYVWMLENGRREPSLTLLQVIAEATKLSTVEEFYRWEPHIMLLSDEGARRYHTLNEET
jgi:transcriptional regulator with XRE-family HTH domain